jgi:hypothetical protein
MGFRLNIRTFVGVGLALVVGVAACGLSVLGDSATAAANVLLDGQGHLVIEARRASVDLNCWYERCEYSSGKVTTELACMEASDDRDGHRGARLVGSVRPGADGEPGPAGNAPRRHSGRRTRGGLREHIDAVGVLADHPLQSSNLSIDAPQALLHIFLVV